MSDNNEFPGFKDDSQPSAPAQSTFEKQDTGYTPQFGFDKQPASEPIYNMQPASPRRKSKAVVFIIIGIIVAVLAVGGVIAFLNRNYISAKLNPLGYLGKSITKNSEAAEANMTGTPSEVLKQFGLAAMDGEIDYDFTMDIEDVTMKLNATGLTDSETGVGKGTLSVDLLGIGVEVETYADKEAVIASTPIIGDGQKFGLKFKDISALNDKYELGLTEEQIKSAEEITSSDKQLDPELEEKINAAFKTIGTPAVEFFKEVKPEVFMIDNSFEGYEGKSVCVEYTLDRSAAIKLWNDTIQSFSDPEVKAAFMDIPTFNEALLSYSLETETEYDDIYDDLFIGEIIADIDEEFQRMPEDFTSTVTFFTNKDGYLTNVYTKILADGEEATLVMGFGADPSAETLFTFDVYGDTTGENYMLLKYDVTENTADKYTSAFTFDMRSGDEELEWDYQNLNMSFDLDWQKSSGKYTIKAALNDLAVGEFGDITFSGKMKSEKEGEASFSINDLSVSLPEDVVSEEELAAVENLDFSFDVTCKEGADVSMPDDYKDILELTDSDIEDISADLEEWTSEIYSSFLSME